MKIDVFSFGMTIYSAALGTNPFISPTLRQTYKNNARAVIPAENTATRSAALQDLMRGVTAKDPRTRWSIFQVASHPWIQADAYNGIHSVFVIHNDGSMYFGFFGFLTFLAFTYVYQIFVFADFAIVLEKIRRSSGEMW